MWGLEDRLDDVHQGVMDQPVPVRRGGNLAHFALDDDEVAVRAGVVALPGQIRLQRQRDCPTPLHLNKQRSKVNESGVKIVKLIFEWYTIWLMDKGDSKNDKPAIARGTWDVTPYGPRPTSHAVDLCLGSA
jgi:hypothetical protein